jgi:hypothetical protein
MSTRLQVGVRVDPHGHVQVGVPGNGLDHVRRGAEFQEQAHDGVPEVVKPHSWQSSLHPDGFRVGVKTSGLDGCADAGGENQIVVGPQLASIGAHLELVLPVFEQHPRG